MSKLFLALLMLERLT